MQRKDDFEKNKKLCAQRFKRFRELMGLNKNQLAKILGCTIQSISYYEKGVTWLPLKQLFKLNTITENVCPYIIGYERTVFNNLEELESAKKKALNILNNLKQLNER